MRKNDQILMWEAYIGESSEAVSMGGPLKVGGSKSPKKSSSEDAEDEDMEDEDGDPYEDEEGDELHGILKKCHSGDITPQEAHKHITKMMKGDAEEDAENIKRPRDKSMDGFLKSQGERPLAHGKGQANKKYTRPEVKTKTNQSKTHRRLQPGNLDLGKIS